MHSKRFMRCGSVAAAMVLLIAPCRKESFLEIKLHKERLINEIRLLLLESVEAEKGAVLAVSDEESLRLAHEAQGAAQKANELRGELEQVIVEDGRTDEIKELHAFDAAWTKFEDVDKRLLALAVANSNLKAARLSAREGAEVLDRFVDQLSDLQSVATQLVTFRLLTQTSVAALRVQTLVPVHIAAADDAEMTHLEQRLHDLMDEVDRNLSSLHETQPFQPRLATASQAWDDYKRILGDVLRLSRENTNVISVDVSIHEKRDVTKKCLAALAALLTAVDSGPRPTR